MAEFTPTSISTKEADITKDGLKINMVLPNKTFKSGKEGFFRQGMVETSDGKKYRLNFQAYEVQ